VLKEACGHEKSLGAKADSTTEPQWLLTKRSHVRMFLGDARVNFLLESGNGNDRPPAMRTEDYMGERASIVCRGLLLMRKMAWLMRVGPCRFGLEFLRGITERRPAGEDRSLLVVAAFRIVALANCAWPALRSLGGPCCDHRPSIDAESDRQRAT
jgi:hypothetical protein